MRLELDTTPTILPPAKRTVNVNRGQNESSEADIFLRNGINAAQAGNRAEARVSLLQAADADPYDESTWLWLASISEYPEELLVFLNNVLEINPENARALEWTAATKSLLSKTFVQRGIDAVESNQKDSAFQYFNQALEYDQQNIMAWLWIASQTDSNEGKIIYLEKALSIDPENEAANLAFKSARDQITAKLFTDAKSAAVAGNTIEANELLDILIEQNPRAEDAWMLRSHLVNGFDQKIEAYQRVLEINPDNAGAKAALESLNVIMGGALISQSVPAAEPETGQNEYQASKENVFSGELQFPEVNRTEDLSDAQIPQFDEVDPSDISFQSDINGFLAGSNNTESETQKEYMQGVEESVDAQPFYTSDYSVDETPAQTSDFDVEETVYNVKPEILELTDQETNFLVNGSPDVEYADFYPDTNITVEDSYVNGSAEIEENMVTAFDAGVAEAADAVVYETPEVIAENGNGISTAVLVCPFCSAGNEYRAIVCESCVAILTLADIEMLLANPHADTNVLRQAVERMEREKLSGNFGERELTMLGIGHLNLRNYQFGYSNLYEASQINPDNVVLSCQVRSLLIRLEEIKIQEAAQESKPKGKTILVIDDSATVRKLIAGKLERSGHDVFCFNDGNEAMDRLQTLVPDLILLDITMPGMNGYEVCELIRNGDSTKDVPVVMISGKDGYYDEARGRTAGTSGFITKPFGPETLMKTVETYLKSEEMISVS